MSHCVSSSNSDLSIDHIDSPPFDTTQIATDMGEKTFLF